MNKVLVIRVCIILICLAITAGCYWHMNQSYDPLSRYPYVTEGNRPRILKYLDNDDIDYLISQKLQPREFLDFVDVDGFDIHYSKYYYTCKKTQKTDNEYIVNFVNKYKSFFNQKQLESLLKYYTYADLTTFYENDKAIYPDLVLESDPSGKYLILDMNHSVYNYHPENLENVDSVVVREEMTDDLKDMRAKYESMIEDQTMKFHNGYLSYDQINEEYLELTDIYDTEVMDLFFLPAGRNELQLGYTVVLEEAALWQDACVNAIDEDGTIDYETVLQNMTPEQKDLIGWIEENAYQFGFVIRYPQEKEEITGHAYQPYVLRYVGKKAAKKMQKDKLTMEEMNFEKGNY